MKVTGSCHCGQIAFETEVDPDKSVICHCTDCQTLSGTAFRTVVPCREADFTLTSGTPKIYVKTAESGNPREQAFCGDCGTPLYATSVGGEDRILGLRVGAIHQRDQIAPKKQLWSRSALGWLHDLDDVPKVEKV